MTYTLIRIELYDCREILGVLARNRVDPGLMSLNMYNKGMVIES